MLNLLSLTRPLQQSFGTKRLAALGAITFLTASSALAQVGTIDTFSSTLSPAYTKTTVLDNDTTRNVTFATNNGILQSTATTTTQAEQTLLLRSDFTLGVGQTLRADIPTVLTSSQDFAIAVGTSAALTGVTAGVTGDTRSSSGGYVISGFRFQNGTLYYYVGGYNTTAALTGIQGTNAPGTSTPFTLLTGFYITRTAANTFNVGYNDNNGPDTLVTSYTLTNTTIGNAVGFYSDMRAAGTIGNLDNLRITAVPEPSTWAMLSVGLILLAWLSRNRLRSVL